MKHPIQKTCNKNNVFRFVENEIVSALLDKYPGGLNEIAFKYLESDPEDYSQLMQLIGYSVSGAPSTVPEDIINIAYDGFDSAEFEKLEDGEIYNDPNTIKESFYERKHKAHVEAMRPLMAILFDIHESYLEEGM